MSLRERFFNALGGAVDQGIGTYLGVSQRNEEQERYDAEKARRDREAARKRFEEKQDAENRKRYAEQVAKANPELFKTPADAMAAIEAGGNIDLLRGPEEPEAYAPAEFVSAVKRGDSQAVADMLARYRGKPEMVEAMRQHLAQTGQGGPPRDPATGSNINQFREEDRMISGLVGTLVNPGLAGQLPVYAGGDPTFGMRDYREGLDPTQPGNFDPAGFFQQYESAYRRAPNPGLFNREFEGAIGNLDPVQQAVIRDAISKGMQGHYNQQPTPENVARDAPPELGPFAGMSFGDYLGESVIGN